MTNTKAHGFNPARSQVCQKEMLNWLRAPISGDLTEVPGIGPVNKKHLQEPSNNGPAITTTQQLMGTYLSLRGENTTQQEQVDKMWEFLHERGVNSHRSGIIDAIASKMNVWMPGSYHHETFAAAAAAKPVEGRTVSEKAAPATTTEHPPAETTTMEASA